MTRATNHSLSKHKSTGGQVAQTTCLSGLGGSPTIETATRSHEPPVTKQQPQRSPQQHCALCTVQGLVQQHQHFKEPSHGPQQYRRVEICI